jgi:hypothetical protein
MRRAILLLGTLALAFTLVPAAGANPPTKTPLPAGDFTISDACAFEVQVEILSNGEFAINFANGTAISAGQLKVRLTNLSDPSKTITLNISGPGRLIDDGATLVADGPWLFYLYPGQLSPGSPGMLLLTVGRDILTANADGTQTFTPAANTTDLCAALA